jgi:F0F1-type ATP synthase assembly protein I
MKPNKTALEYTSLGMTFVITMLLFWYLGSLLDGHFGTRIFQLIGIFFALVGMTIKMINMVKKSGESNKH